MGDAELRWTVRVFRDCLSAAAPDGERPARFSDIQEVIGSGMNFGPISEEQ
jgi:hypothetical protein